MALVGMWLSPGAAWFIFFNVVVGAIAVMSWMGQGGHAPTSSSRRRLARTASIVVMERLRSFSMFPFHHSSADYSLTSTEYCSQEAEEPEPDLLTSLQQLEPEPFRRPELSAPLRARECTATAATMAPPSTPVAAAPPLADAAASENEEEEEEEEEPLISLDEAYALARQGHAPPAAAPAAEPKVEEDVRRRRANAAFPCGRVAAEEVEGKAELNARVDSFIRRFREDLKLERINSIINYTNALRRRGAVDAPASAR